MGSAATCRMVDVDPNAARKLFKGSMMCFERMLFVSPFLDSNSNS